MQDAVRGYQSYVEADRMVFRTERFRAAKGSVLHSGIYNREFASALTAFGTAGIVYLVLVLRCGKTLLTHAVVLAVFVAGFILLRLFVFRERYLKAEFDRGAATVRITETRLLGDRTELIPMGGVERLRIDRTEVGVENPDGADFVKRISAQHGTFIPGFGEEEVFFALQLVLRDGTTRTLYAGDSMEDSMAAYEGIRGFLGLPG